MQAVGPEDDRSTDLGHPSASIPNGICRQFQFSQKGGDTTFDIVNAKYPK